MYILVDLEATCWITAPRPRNQTSELIELAAIAFNQEGIVDSFEVFVKPEINPLLSSSCIDLTGITQEQVDRGFTFITAMQLFESWLLSFDSVKIFSWGAFDRLQLLKEMKCKENITPLYSIIKKDMKSIDKLFQKKFELQKGGLTNVLTHFNLDLEGQEHRAVDDAKNAYRLVAHVYEQIKGELEIL